MHLIEILYVYPFGWLLFQLLISVEKYYFVEKELEKITSLLVLEFVDKFYPRVRNWLCEKLTPPASSLSFFTSIMKILSS